MYNVDLGYDDDFSFFERRGIDVAKIYTENFKPYGISWSDFCYDTLPLMKQEIYDDENIGD